MNLFISKVKLNDLVWTPTPFSQHLILFHGIRLLCHLISILHRLQHLLWSIGTILKLGITSHSILLLCQEIMMRDYSLPKGNTFIVILCIDHLPLDCVLHCLFQVLLVQIFHRVHFYLLWSRAFFFVFVEQNLWILNLNSYFTISQNKGFS